MLNGVNDPMANSILKTLGKKPGKHLLTNPLFGNHTKREMERALQKVGLLPETNPLATNILGESPLAGLDLLSGLTPSTGSDLVDLSSMGLLGSVDNLLGSSINGAFGDLGVLKPVETAPLSLETLASDLSTLDKSSLLTKGLEILTSLVSPEAKDLLTETPSPKEPSVAPNVFQNIVDQIATGEGSGSMYGQFLQGLESSGALAPNSTAPAPAAPEAGKPAEAKYKTLPGEEQKKLTAFLKESYKKHLNRDIGDDEVKMVTSYLIDSGRAKDQKWIVNTMIKTSPEYKNLQNSKK